MIFDLDGTLLNTLDDLADAGNWVCRQHSWPEHPVEAYRYFVGNGIPKLVERFLPEEQRTSEVHRACLEEFSAYYDLHKEVLERYSALSLKPYGGFLNPDIVPVTKGGKVVDYRIEYKDSYIGQMLEYGRKYSTL